MNNKKILFLDTSVSFGGSTIGLHNIVKHIDTNRFSYIIGCFNTNDQYQFLRKAHQHVYLLSDWCLRILSKFNLHLARLYQVIYIFLLITRKKIAVLHSNNGIYYPGILAARLMGIPVICHLRSLPANYFTKQPGLSYLNRFFGKFADKLVAISGSVRLEYIKLGFNHEKIAVIETGIDMDDILKQSREGDVRKIYNIDGKSKILGAIGRLSWEKGIEYLVNALPVILQKVPNLVCIIVGDGPLVSKVKERITALGLSRHVIFTGLLTNPYYVLRALDVLIVPSLKEGRGRVVMESMLLGVPVIASKVGGVCELIKENVDGMFIKPADPNDIAEKVTTLLNNDELRLSLIKNALSKATKQFDAKVEAVRLMNVYEQLRS